jgi:hypothetical protein
MSSIPPHDSHPKGQEISKGRCPLLNMSDGFDSVSRYLRDMFTGAANSRQDPTHLCHQNRRDPELWAPGPELGAPDPELLTPESRDSGETPETVPGPQKRGPPESRKNRKKPGFLLRPVFLG